MSGIAASGLSMRDLLASCAAASAVSTPPAVEEGEGEGEAEGAGACAGEEHRDAA
jgi:hypothetical protein